MREAMRKHKSIDYEKEWLREYTREIRRGGLWDTNFIDYKCYRVFIKEYKADIKLYMHEYYKETGEMVSFEMAGWGLYFVATGQEHKIMNDHAEA